MLPCVSACVSVSAPASVFHLSSGSEGAKGGFALGLPVCFSVHLHPLMSLTLPAVQWTSWPPREAEMALREGPLLTSDNLDVYGAVFGFHNELGASGI